MNLLFCVAAGPRLGYGHLARAASVAQWLGAGVRCALTIRGQAGRFPLATRRLRPVRGTPAALMTSGGWDGVVIDDPNANAAARLVRSARQAGLRVASFHDLGLAPLRSDLAIDGSVVQTTALPATRTLLGTQYTVLDRSLAPLCRQRAANPPDASRVVISLGGGESSRHAVSLATTLCRACPELEILVTTAFSDGRGDSLNQALKRSLGAGVHILAADVRFRELLSTASVAITGAGVTCYEALSLGVATIPVAVVRSQRPTVRAFLTRGLVVATRLHSTGHHDWRRRVVRDVIVATRATSDRAVVTKRAKQLIDTQGGARVARELRRLFRLQRGHSRAAR